MDMHEGQVAVSAEAAARIVAAEFPEWAGLPLAPVLPGGTDNAVFRLGEGFSVRFPLRPGDPGEVGRRLRAEASAARELFGRTRFATPAPVAVGGPREGYPLPWAVQTWLPGTPADRLDPGGSTGFALDLAEFVRGARAVDTRGRTFRGAGRGGRIADHDAWMRTCLERSEELLDVPRLRGLWEGMRELPRGGEPDLMCHGDLIPGNLLVRDGRLAGGLDVGGLGPADPALDLVCAWHMLDDGPRHAFREALDSGDQEWERGRAWAFQQAMGLVWYYRYSNPAMSRTGRRTLERITGATR
ncbi:aminoglycoside phosphotransferase family protein [Streptomonospora nanhaiensis]|uniref:Aminoglycoside phosphotransferase family protein n=1 Tax=Streptomonospora nanhaiensis TaxID=1323731 RepID=A0ABY6YQX9_9ACTN|nr:aminoglycoside phosphotransferase family protein [Streptomonospora nanhaiensis]WAE74768.1 aminoglycoside phosphotransferase family protein [Streptomonospora nanhaiensis]